MNSFLFRRKAHKTVSFVVVAVVVLVWFLLKPVARPISRLLHESSPKVGEPSPALYILVDFFFSKSEIWSIPQF